ncbi:MAG: anhydro-N-acetylmuramic acid kinase [Geminicoccaceae bacterium]|nr:anhydro-N-acetylmuramic acid kinase [Geminicoccaceae bacterium]MCB9967587.1 anhydro-N-acetylmuramic acid kinase [Geminicoccaceae bacterium]
MNALTRLQDLAARPTLMVAGLMTGTSVDGLDVALCRIRPALDTMPELVLGRTLKLPADLRSALLAAKDAGVPALARADLALGRFQAEALAGLLAESGLGPVDLVGSHGQTAYHEHRVTTLQIGEPACLAQALDCPVVADFRRADVAAGGSGAPLVPIFDRLFLGQPGKGVLALNIGGIANFTALPAGGGEPVAMDCGPGNMIVDGLVRRMTGGKQDYDADGAFAANRRIDRNLLDELASMPALHTPPPRSLGREEFGDAFVDELVARVAPRSEAEWCELIATATALSAEALARTVRAHVERTTKVDRVLVSGGGVHNATLMRQIELRLPGTEVASTASVGLDPDFKEAIAFAAFAVLALFAPPLQTGGFTGADRPVRLGKLALP